MDLSATPEPPARQTPPADPVRPTRVVLVDGHPVLRAGLAAILAGTPGIEVAGQAASAQTALPLLPTADVLVLDVPVGQPESAALVARLRAFHPGLRIIVWGSLPRGGPPPEPVPGTDAFVPKDADPATLREAVRTVAAGSRFAGRPTPARTGRRYQGPYGLTRQEMRVLRLLPRGLTNRQIGDQLGVSDQTVKTHLSSAMRKLNVRSRVEAVAVVVQGRLGLR